MLAIRRRISSHLVQQGVHETQRWFASRQSRSVDQRQHASPHRRAGAGPIADGRQEVVQHDGVVPADGCDVRVTDARARSPTATALHVPHTHSHTHSHTATHAHTRTRGRWCSTTQLEASLRCLCSWRRPTSGTRAHGRTRGSKTRHLRRALSQPSTRVPHRPRAAAKAHTRSVEAARGQTNCGFSHTPVGCACGRVWGLNGRSHACGVRGRCREDRVDLHTTGAHTATVTCPRRGRFADNTTVPGTSRCHGRHSLHHRPENTPLR